MLRLPGALVNRILDRLERRTMTRMSVIFAPSALMCRCDFYDLSLYELMDHNHPA